MLFIKLMNDLDCVIKLSTTSVWIIGRVKC